MLSEGSFCCDERGEGGGIWLFQDIWSLQKGTPSSQKVTSRKPLSSRMYIIFQSTPSSQKVTAYFYGRRKRNRISIHTFLTEGDKRDLRMRHLPHHFNPHLRFSLFQSTPSSQKVTQALGWEPRNLKFQSAPSSQKVTEIEATDDLSGQFQSAPSSQKVTNQ